MRNHQVPDRNFRAILFCFLVVVGSVGLVVAQPGRADAAPALWGVVPDKIPGALNAVSCTGPNFFCMAAGNGVIESWSGRWSVTQSSGALGVSCTSSTFCVAVGGATLVESWDGTAWSGVPSPSPGTIVNVLNGVSCTSLSFCVAVGYSNNSGPGPSGDQTLVETWNGSAWSVVPSPSPGTIVNVLNGVSCTAPTFCAAVGYSNNSSTGPSGDQTVAEVWDGNTWSVTPSTVATGLFTGVSCTDSTFCMAVGSAPLPLYPFPLGQVLAESWNGSAWSVGPSPIAGIASYFLGVSCTGPTSCTAVGDSLQDGGGTTHPPYSVTVLDTWNGSTWSDPSQTSSPTNEELSGVSLAGSTSGMAVGFTGVKPLTLLGVSSPPPPLQITTSSPLPSGTVGVAYAATVAAFGGNPPYTWKLTTGPRSLPKGLRFMRPTGVIRGTPSATGTFTFTVQVHDTKVAHRQDVVTQVLSVTIS